MCLATKLLETQIKQLELENRNLLSQFSGVDKQLSEFYHKVEVMKFNAVEGFFLAKELQVILHKRRNLKFQQCQISSLINLHSRSLDKLIKYESNYFKNTGSFSHEEYVTA